MLNSSLVEVGAMSGISGYVFFMLSAAGITGLVNKRKARTVAMPFTVGAIVVAIAWIAELALGLTLISAGRIDSHRASYLLTSTVMDGAIALGLSLVAALYDRRRRLTASGPTAS